MPIDYLKMLQDLVRERESWVHRRDEAMRQISRLSELIRSTLKMLPEEQLSKLDAIFERIDNRPTGLTTAIRLCFTAGKDHDAKHWLTPVEIRDYLKQCGFNFENYRANPLASIHTTLKRMVPHEVQCRKVKGQKVYRLKSVEQWSAALRQTREWLAGREYVAIGRGPWLAALQNSKKKPDGKASEKAEG